MRPVITRDYSVTVSIQHRLMRNGMRKYDRITVTLRQSIPLTRIVYELPFETMRGKKLVWLCACTYVIDAGRICT